ncbi:hypothetical protein ACF0H5_014267 [Mactra antiquata]
MKFIFVVIAVVSVSTEIFGIDQYKDAADYCDQTITMNDKDSHLHLYYRGETFSDKCKITITTDDISNKICSKPEKFDINSCVATVEYHNSYYSSFPDEEYTCLSKQYSTYCTHYSSLVIAFDKTSGGMFARSDDVELIISVEDDDFSNIVDAAVTTVYVIVGVIVSVVVIVIILVVVVVICCCRKRRNQSGTVYRAPAQAATTTTVAYAMANQPAYQPQAGYVQPGYQQPPPQPGFQQPPTGYQQPPPSMGYQQPAPAGFQQPPPPTGYQQPPGAYPPAPQQGYAGYQTGADAPITEKASAPPMEPPPYSG